MQVEDTPTLKSLQPPQKLRGKRKAVVTKDITSRSVMNDVVGVKVSPVKEGVHPF